MASVWRWSDPFVAGCRTIRSDRYSTVSPAGCSKARPGQRKTFAALGKSAPARCPCAAPEEVRGRGETPAQFGDQAFGGDRSLHDVQQRFTGVFIKHRRDLDRLAVDGGIKWKPNAQNTFGASATTCGADDMPARLRGLCTRRCRPSSFHRRCTFLFTAAMLIMAQRGPGPPKPMARMGGGVAAQPLPQLSVGIGRGQRDRAPAVGAAGKPDRFARPPLGHAPNLVELVHRAALGGLLAQAIDRTMRSATTSAR